ncbi:fimbrial protein [Gallibacterium genomosp. 3]|uniref:fimbrial protein n=1 Tax=Gallibacterium genomosp. 3 TaxID=505345 RepID=UPI0008027976|nr:fimbrial protein [Gallibacterium genomosp. 3]
MKKSFLITALVSALTSQVVLAATGVGTDTHKQGGTITFEGRVVDVTCHIKDNEGNKRVVLPTVSKNAFPTVGSTAGTTGFKIELVDCTAQGGVTKVRAYFAGNSKVNASGRIKNVFQNNDSPNQDSTWHATAPGTTQIPTSVTTAAQGVELQLLDQDGVTPIDINTDANRTNGQSSQFTDMGTATAGGNVNLRYAVRYYSTLPLTATGNGATLSPGGVRGYVDYILDYQ